MDCHLCTVTLSQVILMICFLNFCNLCNRLNYALQIWRADIFQKLLYCRKITIKGDISKRSRHWSNSSEWMKTWTLDLVGRWTLTAGNNQKLWSVHTMTFHDASHLCTHGDAAVCHKIVICLSCLWTTCVYVWWRVTECVTVCVCMCKNVVHVS